MNTNLVLVSGLSYGVAGALILFASHWNLYRSATRIVAGYPRVLAKLSAKRYDARLGLGLLGAGTALQLFAAYGFHAPLSAWRYPAYAAVALIALYAVARLLASRTVAAGNGKARRKAPARGLFETRRSLRLREAAELESANLELFERRRAPRDDGIVYLARDIDRRWWSERFGVSVDVLVDVVRQVGPMVSDIERYLGIGIQRRSALAA